MKTLAICAAIAFVLLPLAPAQVHADDKEETEALVTRLFDVSALTQGRQDFMRELSASVDPGFVDEGPLFGSEGVEPVYPVGQVDELIELIQVQVKPESWESTLGAGMRSQGEQTLVVRAFPEVVDEVAVFLGALQKRLMRRVAIDVETFRLTQADATALLLAGNSQLADPAKLAALRGGEAAGPSVSILAYERHRAAIYAGRQRAYIADYDTEVANSAKISDPIVCVANLGLSVDVRTTLGPEAKSALVVLDAALSEIVGSRTVDSGGGCVIELPENAVAKVFSRVEVPVGAWALIDGQSAEQGESSWIFAVRVAALPDDGLAEKARGITLHSPVARPARSFELRTFDIGMLQEMGVSRAGENVFLVPSNFTPPEPPELPEPMPLFPADSLVELLRESIAPGSWDMRGVFIEARNGYLHVRNSKDVLSAIERTLALIRPEVLWSLVTTSAVVEMDAALAHRLESAPGRVLEGEPARLLTAALADGSARRRGSVRVMNMRGGRNNVTSGRRIAYLSDYAVELAESAVLANPIINSCLSGSGLDVEPRLTAGGSSVQMNVRFTGTNVQTPLRKAPSPHGDIDVPVMDVFRARAAMRAPLGKTLVLASAGAKGRKQLLLLTSHLRRASR